MALANRKPFPIAQSNPTSPFAEAYRTIQTNIELKSPTVRTILVTSARPGEGKTSTAANLAIVFSQSGKRVLLVDADLRNPQVHDRFHITPEVGLAQVLKQECELQNAIVTTEILNLQILPSGPVPANASGLLSSLTFASVLGKFKSRFDLVVIDSPPVLAVNDALVITRNVDGVVFVVDAKRTNRIVAQRALGAIRQVNGEILGGVLNRIPKGNRDTYYYGAMYPSVTTEV